MNDFNTLNHKLSKVVLKLCDSCPWVLYGGWLWRFQQNNFFPPETLAWIY